MMEDKGSLYDENLFEFFKQLITDETELKLLSVVFKYNDSEKMIEELFDLLRGEENA